MHLIKECEDENTRDSCEEFQIESDFCDVTLACEDKQIKAQNELFLVIIL